jgi:hypothetical protein
MYSRDLKTGLVRYLNGTDWSTGLVFGYNPISELVYEFWSTEFE